VAGANNANASNLMTTSCQVIGSTITKNGGGRLHLGHTNNNVGRWIVNQGALTSVNASNLFGSQPTLALSNYITLDGGGFGFIAPGAMSIGANRGIYLGPNGGQIGNQGTGGIITIDSPITGPGSLHFPGTTEWPGQLQGDNCTYIISNTNNNYQGITRIAIPEVRLGADQVFPIGTTLLISNVSIGGRLNLNGFNQTVATVILDSTTGNSRIFDTVGTGSLSASLFDLRRSASAANVTAVLAGNGTLTKTTSGNITLGAPNTYTGDTFLQAGSLTLPAAGRFGNGVGTLHLQGANLIVSESRTDATAIMNPTWLEAETLVQGTANATNHILFIHGGTWTIVAGTMYLYNPNTNGFLFQVALTNTFNFSSPIDISTGCHLISYNPAGSDQTFSGGLSGAGMFRRAVSTGDGGRTIFTTDNTYSGGTIVTAGTLLVNNTGSSGSGTGSGAVTVTSVGVLGGNGTISGAVLVTNGGNLLAAAGGILTLQGGVDLSGSGTNTWELAALKDSNSGIAGTDFGQIVLTAGELQLGGISVLSLKFSNGTAPNAALPFWQSSHSWKIINLSGGLNTANATFSSIANGSYGAGNFSTSVDPSGNIILTFTISAQSAPSITSHPQSRTNVVGTTAYYTVAANGSAPLTYQWFRSTSPFTPISGASSATLTLPNVQAASAGSYFARAYNGLGNDTSQIATLTVVAPPAIQPLSGAGTTNVVIKWNTVGGMNYQVQYSLNLATANWIPVSTLVGTGGTVSVTNNPPAGDPQRYYRVIIW
jgi:fibronectin-binding autotransporter adhesin